MWCKHFFLFKENTEKNVKFVSTQLTCDHRQSKLNVSVRKERWQSAFSFIKQWPSMEPGHCTCWLTHFWNHKFRNTACSGNVRVPGRSSQTHVVSLWITLPILYCTICKHWWEKSVIPLCLMFFCKFTWAEAKRLCVTHRRYKFIFYHLAYTHRYPYTHTHTHTEIGTCAELYI